jgi:ABC-type cobalamin/Fe3+-siderophores transport system ATPase subunit
MRKGKFITIDGVEGAGKSTQIDFICQYLTDKDINIVLTREPGGSAIGGNDWQNDKFCQIGDFMKYSHSKGFIKSLIW